MEKEKMINEAVERMEILGLLDLPEESIIRDFKENNTVYISRPRDLGVMTGVLYKPSQAEQKLIEKIEKEYEILVYHVIRNETNVGVMYAMLYVSGYEEEWRADRKALMDIGTGVAHPLACVWNAGFVEEDAEDLSEGFKEWGAISVIEGAGGLYMEF